jgi:hypothetical protein
MSLNKSATQRWLLNSWHASRVCAAAIASSTNCVSWLMAASVLSVY